jgi:hypothetical protein
MGLRWSYMKGRLERVGVLCDVIELMKMKWGFVVNDVGKGLMHEFNRS